MRSAGVAAINVGGQTINTFAGIGLGRGDREKLIQKVVSSDIALDRWKRTHVLIIDEISMLGRELFELVDGIARRAKGNDLPFGGIQVIVVGDFLQLPPVQNHVQGKFCFESSSWSAAGFNLPSGRIFLRNIIRQSDPVFIDMLNNVRVGQLPEKYMEVLNACVVSQKPLPVDGIMPTKLYCINKDVDNENTHNLNALPGDVIDIEAIDEWIDTPSAKRRGILDIAEKTIPKNIQLKKGAQVMLLRNRSLYDPGPAGDKQKSLGLVNGSRGVVVGFTKSVVGEGMVPIVRFDNGKELTIGRVDYVVRTPDSHVLKRKQIPLKLAW
jgi:ATP-dependent DNA helicase PIF1